MKKGNKIILVAVMLLVLLFGVGQFFSGSNLSTVTPSGSSSTASNATTTPATRVIAYVPPQPSTSTLAQSGSCWTNSIAAPYRADAWRCTVGNAISDPCFEIPTQRGTLYCGVNPAKPNSTSTFALKLTKVLPKAQTLQGGVPKDWAWLVQLSDGTLCTPFTGTRPFTADGKAASYGCAPGPLGQDVMIFDDLNSSSSVWTAHTGAFTVSSVATTSLPTIQNEHDVVVSTVWQ